MLLICKVNAWVLFFFRGLSSLHFCHTQVTMVWNHCGSWFLLYLSPAQLSTGSLPSRCRPGPHPSPCISPPILLLTARPSPSADVRSLFYQESHPNSLYFNVFQRIPMLFNTYQDSSFIIFQQFCSFHVFQQFRIC